MTTHDLVGSAVASLLRTRGRSFLTMLGIVIGIMSVILMLSVGEAAQRYILAQVDSFGSDILFIQNGAAIEEGQPSLFIKESLTMKDLKKFQTESWVSIAVGKFMQSDELTANGLDTHVEVLGTTPDELRLGSLKTEIGTFFTQASVDSRAREAVLGHDIAEKAFGMEDPIGKIVKLSGQGFRVVGVMQKAGTQGFTNVDKQVYIPVTSALDLYNRRYLTYMTLKSTLPIQDAKRRVEAVLRDRHNIENPTDDPSKDDFHVQTQEDLIKSAEQVTGILQILLISIAAISLIVGGIGIMNIMYVTVTERTREIGLRKAIGAREGDVLRQFLVEAVTMTSLGGIFGVAFGVGFSWIGIQIISQFQDGWSFGFSTNGVILGLVVSSAIGLAFGYFPARRAARLNPIDAMRFE
jgi:putative ABC transport system permease protein